MHLGGQWDVLVEESKMGHLDLKWVISGRSYKNRAIESKIGQFGRKKQKIVHLGQKNKKINILVENRS